MFRFFCSAFLIILFCFIFPICIFAFAIDGIQVNSTTFISLSAEPIENSSSPGLITQGFGVSVPMSINKILYVEPVISLYSSNVVLDKDNRAVLANIETANRVSLLNLEIRPEVGATFEITDTLNIGFSMAPMLTFRIPIMAHDYEDGTEAKTSVWQYFIGKGRFFSLYTAGVLKWKATETIALVFKTGFGLPVYHFWDGEDKAFYNHLAIQPELGFIFRF